MAEKRDNLFPSGSIGRIHGSQLQRASSPSPSLTREPLTAHPLLSPTPSSTAVNTTGSAEVHGVSTAPRYVPYTPRHRTAAATTGTSLQSSVTVSPQQQNGGATSKLQLMNLKAGAQSVGLDTGSVGWEILEKLVGEHDHSPDWNDIWTALTTGKVRGTDWHSLACLNLCLGDIVASFRIRITRRHHGRFHEGSHRAVRWGFSE